MDADSTKPVYSIKTCGDLKKKVGTLYSTISTLQTQQSKMTGLMKAQVTEHQQKNFKFNILYSHRYGDAPPS